MPAPPAKQADASRATSTPHEQRKAAPPDRRTDAQQQTPQHMGPDDTRARARSRAADADAAVAARSRSLRPATAAAAAAARAASRRGCSGAGSPSCGAGPASTRARCWEKETERRGAASAEEPPVRARGGTTGMACGDAAAVLGPVDDEGVALPTPGVVAADCPPEDGVASGTGIASAPEDADAVADAPASRKRADGAGARGSTSPSPSLSPSSPPGPRGPALLPLLLSSALPVAPGRALRGSEPVDSSCGRGSCISRAGTVAAATGSDCLCGVGSQSSSGPDATCTRAGCTATAAGKLALLREAAGAWCIISAVVAAAAAALPAAPAVGEETRRTRGDGTGSLSPSGPSQSPPPLPPACIDEDAGMTVSSLAVCVWAAAFWSSAVTATLPPAETKSGAMTEEE